MSCLKCLPSKLGTSLRLVIGDEPSIDDALAGAVFSDGYGRVLDVLLRKAGIRREEVTMALLIPYPISEKASKAERQNAITHGMQAHLLPLLKSRPWTRVDIVGEEAMRILTGKKESIFTWRGSPLEIDLERLEQIYGN